MVKFNISNAYHSVILIYIATSFQMINKRVIDICKCVCALILKFVCFYVFLLLFDLSGKWKHHHIFNDWTTNKQKYFTYQAFDLKSIGMIEPHRCVWQYDICSVDIKTNLKWSENFDWNNKIKCTHLLKVIILESWMQTLKTVKYLFIHIFIIESQSHAQQFAQCTQITEHVPLHWL